MRYGSILVPIDDHPEAAGSLSAAIRLAIAFDARLEGLAIVPPLAVAQRLRPRQSAARLMKKEWESDRKEARSAVKRFESQARKAGAIRAGALAVEGEAVPSLAKQARTADLVVLPFPGEDDVSFLGGHAIESAVLSVGRPVLLVPDAGLPATFPGKVLIAWNGSRESARAVSDALPLLSLAKSVVVFTSGPAGDEGPVHSARAALAYLECHGVKAQSLHAHVTDERLGDVILGRAGKLGANLVVMGAYGRARFAELVLGGVTRAILRKGGMPVLVSH